MKIETIEKLKYSKAQIAILDKEIEVLLLKLKPLQKERAKHKYYVYNKEQKNREWKKRYDKKYLQENKEKKRGYNKKYRQEKKDKLKKLNNK